MKKKTRKSIEAIAKLLLGLAATLKMIAEIIDALK